MEIAGCSSDMGGEAGTERPGLQFFLEEKDNREIEVLLVLDSARLSRDQKQCRKFLLGMKKAESRYFPLWRGCSLPATVRNDGLEKDEV